MTPLAQLLSRINISQLNDEVVIATDSSLHGYAWVAKTYGVKEAESLLAVMQQAGLNGAAMTYCGLGFDLFDKITQEQLTELAQVLPELCNALKQRGITTAPQWRTVQETKPTDDEIKLALEQASNRKAFVEMLNELVNPLLADESVTVAEFKVAVAGYGK